MRKTILIGSIMVFIILLLIPSIPAIQSNMSEKVLQNDMLFKLNNIDFSEVIDNFISIEYLKHPFLFLTVWIITLFRLSRFKFLDDISCDRCVPWCRWPHPHIEIIYPMLFLRAWILGMTTGLWMYFWMNLSNIMEWNWNLYS